MLILIHFQILGRVAPEVASSEPMGRGLNSPLMQLLRLAWGYREINDDHIDKVQFEVYVYNFYL